MAEDTILEVKPKDIRIIGAWFKGERSWSSLSVEIQEVLKESGYTEPEDPDELQKAPLTAESSPHDPPNKIG